VTWRIAKPKERFAPVQRITCPEDGEIIFKVIGWSPV
jgi:hypothetical protein